MKRILKTLLLVVLLWMFFVTVCCSPRYNVPIEEQPTTPAEPVLVKDSSLIKEDSSTMIFMVLSGGGTRAAQAGLTAINFLDHIPYIKTKFVNPKEGVPYIDTIKSSLMEQVDYLSGISGGSFPTAAWCLPFYRDNMDLFRERFITKNIQGMLIRKVILHSPALLMSKIFPIGYNQSNIAAKYYDKNVFYGATYEDFLPHPTPWIHGTVTAVPGRFTFEPKYFDWIGSDINKYWVAEMCATSSAFPGLGSIGLKNYGDTLDLMADRTYYAARRNSNRNIMKHHYCQQREFFNDKENTKYIYNIDGGVWDNMGLSRVLEALGTNGVANRAMNNGKLKRLVIIAVNAGTSSDEDAWAKSNYPPNIVKVMGRVSTTAMDELSDLRLKMIRDEAMQQWKGFCGGYIDKSECPYEKPYIIEVNARLAMPSIKHMFNKIPTSFKLDSAQLQVVDAMVKDVLTSSTELRRLLESIKSE